MKRIIFTYGVISGSIIIGITVGGMLLMEPGSGMAGSEWMGYLIMIVVLSLIFFGIKTYRDEHQGGVIKFSKAFLMGIGISVVAGLVYTIVWELYMQYSGGEFIELYVESYLEQMRVEGAGDQEIRQARSEMEGFMEMYENVAIRLGITFMEIFPVGFAISLISAGLLRKSDFLPK